MIFLLMILLKLIMSSIEQIYNEEESWTTKDCTKKEMKEFIEQSKF